MKKSMARLNSKLCQQKIPGVKLRGFFTLCIKKLLLALRNSHGHSDGGADHGVVAHAQEAHHFHGRNRLWRFLNWGTRVPEEVSLSFLNARHTSIFIAWYAFFIGGILSYDLFRKPDVWTKLYIFAHLLSPLKNNEQVRNGFELKPHIFQDKYRKRIWIIFMGYPAILDTPFAIIKPESERWNKAKTSLK